MTLQVPFAPAAPEIATEAIPHCPTCGGNRRTAFARGHDYELETCRNEWQFWQCSACATVWLDPRPETSTLGVIYPASYYAYQMDKISPIARKGKAMLDRLKFRSILAHTGAPKSFLDIGCGDGRYLDFFAQHGIPKSRIYGLELSEEPIRLLRERGYQAFQRRVEECTEIADGSIDLATMFHVIEHVADPLRVVQQIARWLSPNGCLVVETPNIDSWDARLFKDRWWGGYHFPRHWTLFQADSLARLMNAAGLEVVDVAYQTGHSFWMYSLHHVLRYGTRSGKAVAPLFDPVRSVIPLVTFTGFDISRRMIGFKTSSILMIVRRKMDAGHYAMA
jgi:2-polyprenyl-3-methyl-5-hydroxy-6-metoxy-1,4-benzoquinol methylase